MHQQALPSQPMEVYLNGYQAGHHESHLALTNISELQSLESSWCEFATKHSHQFISRKNNLEKAVVGCNKVIAFLAVLFHLLRTSADLLFSNKVF